MCDFENPDLCRYQYNCTVGSKFQWMRGSGQTPSRDTGPYSDGSGNPHGRFCTYLQYIGYVDQKTRPKKRGRNRQIISVSIAPTPPSISTTIHQFIHFCRLLYVCGGIWWISWGHDLSVVPTSWDHQKFQPALYIPHVWRPYWNAVCSCSRYSLRKHFKAMVQIWKSMAILA